MTNALTFVDTNVLVYARDTTDADKHRRASDWMTRLWLDETGRTSTQALNEYYVTVTRKLEPGLARDVARNDVRDLAAWRPAIVDRSTIETAWDLEDRFSLSWWDSLIVATAIHLGCDRLLTEDLAAGTSFDGVVVTSPFLTSPD
jgi:predicted nucleic acid-binding protein